MKLVVYSHKPCWVGGSWPTGYATHGGFPYQMGALSQLFDQTVLVLPQRQSPGKTGEIPLSGHKLRVVPLSNLPGRGLCRKLLFPFWFLRNLRTMVRQALRADAIHVPVPGDISTTGMILALLLKKPLFVRHCGNWLAPRTVTERFLKWSMERFAGGRNVMMATGGQPYPPSTRNPHIQWIFSTSLTEEELHQVGKVRSLPRQLAIKLIIVCRQESDKGTDLVLRSLPRLAQSGKEFRLDIVGDGTELPALKGLASALSIDQHVIFHGKVTHEEVLDLLQQAHIFCYPTSASEGFPKVVLEALASGLPVATTRVSVLPQLIGNGCGVLLDDLTEQALASAVKEIVSDPGTYQEMSRQALNTAQSYSLEHWQQRIAKTLSESWGALQEDGSAQ